MLRRFEVISNHRILFRRPECSELASIFSPILAMDAEASGESGPCYSTQRPPDCFPQTLRITEKTLLSGA